MSDKILEFRAGIKIEKAVETEDGRWIVSGPIASMKKDYDGEFFDPDGIMKGMEMHQKLGGHVDFEHQYRKTLSPAVIIGKRVNVEKVDGVPWMATELYKSKPLAKELWEHVQAGGEAGYSIEGRVVSRDRANAAKITEPEIHLVTLSLSPKGFDNRVFAGGIPSLGAVLKAISRGEAIEGCIRNYGEPITKGVKMDDDKDEDEDADDDGDAVKTCPTCGGPMKKAMETGEGIVMAGAGSPGNAAPMRTQELMGAKKDKTEGEGKDERKCESCGKPVKGKSRHCFPCAVKAYAEGKAGPKEPTAVAAALTAKGMPLSAAIDLAERICSE